MGSSAASNRKAVITETFSSVPILGQADIICLQELVFHPTGRVANQYLPFLDDYECCLSRETEGRNKYNAIFYKTKKFVELPPTGSTIDRAFSLMDMKWKVYEKIKRGGDERKKRVEEGLATPWGRDDTEIRMCTEVFQECQEPEQDCNAAIKRYTVPGEMETKSPKTLLMRRMAICCLQHEQIPHYKLVVISLHCKRKGPENFAYLLFDFLSKIEAPVLIAGDFNCDITKVPSLDKFLSEYSIEKYEIRHLRHRLPRIDFICLKNYVYTKCLPGTDFQDYDTLEYTTQLLDTVAHDFEKNIEDKKIKEKEITNHSPLSATLTVKPTCRHGCC